VLHVGVIASLTPTARRILVGNAIAAIGGGLTLPFLVIYLGQVRELGTPVAAGLVAVMALIGLGFTPAVGTLVDRVGPRPVLMVGLAVTAAGTAALAFVQGLVQIATCIVVMAAGQSASWAPQTALYARVTPVADRQQVFGLQFMVLNLGLGIGGIVSAGVVDVLRPQTFSLLYLCNAAALNAYLMILVALRGVGVGSSGQTREPGSPTAGYRVVLGDRALRRLAVAACVLLVFGYGSLEVGLPTYLTLFGGLQPSVVAVAYVANTLVIVLAQIFVIRRIQGRSRTRLAGLVGLMWALAWLLVGISISFPPGIAAGVACLGVAVFALGETIWSPVYPAIVNDLASDELRGRYNAVSSWTWGLAGTAGPALAAGLLGIGHPVIWVGVVVVGCVAAGVLLAGLGRLLTPEQDGRPVPQPDGAH